MLILTTNPIFESFTHSDLFGKAIFAGLFLLSVITWTVFLSKWRYAKAIQKKGPSLKESLFRRWQNPLTAEVKPQDHPYFRLFHCFKQEAIAMTSIGKGDEKKAGLNREEMKLLQENLFGAVDREINHFQKNLFLLSTVVTLAPFLGLLGTVWGILLTFSELAKGSTANANALVMNGLAMALGTTVVGLLVAIPALLSYNWHKSTLIHFASDMEDFAKSLLSSLERYYRQSENKLD